ncbi:MAG: permease-like cell division protein FtsX [Oscillospiraceae bacterium]|nr:permease-like cell division protein FtsX [Oscillospiraceae bacterium]
MNRLGYYIREGVDSIFNHGLISFATICVIVACLLIMGSFASVAWNVNQIIGSLEDQVSILAFVDDSWTETEARSLEQQLLAVDNVAGVQFVTRAQALEEYLGQLEYSELFDEVEPEILRDRYLVYLKDISLMAGTQNRLKDVPGIARVNAHLGIAQGMVAVRRVVNVVSVVMILLLLVVSVFIMANTLRLAAFTRRSEVAIVRMIGATNSFIRGPFNVEGMILGLTGALIAFLAQWLLYTTVTGRIAASSLSFLDIVPFSALLLPMLACFLIIGLLVAIFGSRIAIRNYMRI